MCGLEPNPRVEKESPPRALLSLFELADTFMLVEFASAETAPTAYNARAQCTPVEKPYILQSMWFSVPKILKKTRFESQRYLRERDHEAGRIACRRRTDHGRNDGGSDRLWLFLSYTYFSPRPSSGGNLFDLRPRRIAFASPSSARPPPCSCGGATWAGCLDNPTFVAAATGHLSSDGGAEA